MKATGKDTAANILVVDDEESMRELLRVLLEAEGYSVRTAASGSLGLRILFAWQPDLVVLDIVMPEMNGWVLLQRIRDMSDIPVIMLTALDQEADKVRGLRSGADDYISKPISNEEFVARVRAVLRRSGFAGDSQQVYTDGEVSIDFEQHRVFVRGREVALTPIEFKLLMAFVQNAGALLTTDRLLDLAWGNRLAGPGNVRLYINYLRKKLEEDPARPQIIETVRGFGYRYLSEDVGEKLRDE